MSSALTVDGAIATISLEGPLDGDRVAELSGFCDHVAEEEGIRVCLLTATADGWGGWSEAALAAAEETGLIGDPFADLANLPQAIVAVLDADTLDGGLELALCADIRVAGAGISVGLPAAAEALPIAGGLQRLSRAIGRVHSLELALTGDLVDAATARSWGLLSLVDEDPAAAAAGLASRLAERGPIATRFAKEAVRRGLEMPLDQALRYETDLTILLQTTFDRDEGVRAFVEKRQPKFEGR